MRLVGRAVWVVEAAVAEEGAAMAAETAAVKARVDSVRAVGAVIAVRARAVA